MTHQVELTPIEIWQEISIYTGFLAQIRLRRVCTKLQQLEIHDFYNIDDKYLTLLTNQILEYYPFIQYLKAIHPKITNINHLTKLKRLDASDSSGLDDHGVQSVNPIELNISNNSKITNINHMTRLQRLYATNLSAINN